MPLPDTEEFNIGFVRVIEAYKVLYDSSSPEYVNKNETDRAWNQVAQNFDATEEECKIRWRNLRSAFGRYLRNRSSTKKPYYLLDAMQFLVPYMKSRAHTGLFPTMQDFEFDMDPDIKMANEIQDELPSPIVLYSGPDTPTSQGENSSASRRKLSRTTPPEDLERAVANYFTVKRAIQQCQSESSPDMDFFKSLLPDIQHLTPSKKRKFKTKVLQILDEIAGDDVLYSIKDET